MKNYYAAIDENNTVTHVLVSEFDAGDPEVRDHFEDRGRWVYVEEPCRIGDVLDVDGDGCATVAERTPSDYSGAPHPASREIFEAVFGQVAAEEILAAAEDAEHTPQDYAMECVTEAKKCGLETDEYEAYAACCEELGVATS